MLAISPTSRPSYLVELVGRALASVAGPLPLASANKGKNSEDPEVEEVFNRDPQTYHGKLRIATGLAILQVRLSLPPRPSLSRRALSTRTHSDAHEAHLADSRSGPSRSQGILALSAAQAHLRVPFLVCHGTGDRVTSHHGSEDLHRLAESADKELKLFPEVRARSLSFSLSFSWKRASELNRRRAARSTSTSCCARGGTRPTMRGGRASSVPCSTGSSGTERERAGEPSEGQGRKAVQCIFIASS